MVTARLSCHPLVLLAILCGFLLVHICDGQNWSSFQNKHIDYPKSSAPNTNTYCDRMMTRRKLNPIKCKPLNTFVNEDPAVLKQVCVSKGTHYKDNLYDSIQSFNMINCKNVGGTKPAECKYVGTSEEKRIRVACEGQLPVHLEATI